VTINQNLLQGFRPSVNNRAIRVSKNQRHISDLTFKYQVMASVANVVSLYWDLVTFNDDLKVKQHTFELNKNCTRTTSAAGIGGHRSHRHHHRGS